MSEWSKRPRKQSELIVNPLLTDPASPEIQRMSKIYKFLSEEASGKPNVGNKETEWEDAEIEKPEPESSG